MARAGRSRVGSHEQQGEGRRGRCLRLDRPVADRERALAARGLSRDQDCRFARKAEARAALLLCMEWRCGTTYACARSRPRKELMSSYSGVPRHWSGSSRHSPLTTVPGRCSSPEKRASRSSRRWRCAGSSGHACASCSSLMSTARTRSHRAIRSARGGSAIHRP